MAEEKLFAELVTRNILSVGDNRLKLLNEINISMYGSKAWAFTLQEIGKRMGTDYLYQKGYLMGTAAAEELAELLAKEQKYVPKMLYELANAIMATGFGIVMYKRQADLATVEVQHNQIIKFAKELYGESSVVCHFYRGVYSGFIEVFEKRKIALKEESCICRGDEKCRFSG